MKSVTTFKIFENNNLYTETPEYGLPELKRIFQQLIDSGDITLGNDNKSIEDLLPKFIDKVHKYPRFGFEAIMMDFADDKKTAIISEGDKERMGDYITKMKNDFGVDTSKLDDLIIYYKAYYELIDNIDEFELEVYNTEELELEGLELEEFRETKEQLEEMINESKGLKHYVDDLIAEMVRLAPEVVKQL